MGLLGVAGGRRCSPGTPLGRRFAARCAGVRGRSAERVLPAGARADRGAGGGVRARRAARRDAVRAVAGAERRVLPGAGRAWWRAGRGDVPRVLGADDAAAGGRDPGRAPGRAGAPRRVRVSRDHAPGRDRRVGEHARAGAITARSAVRRCTAAGCARWSRSRRSSGSATKAGADAVAFVAAARAPAGAGARVGADVGGDDQARALRADPRAVSVGCAGAAVGRPDAARRSARSRRSAACCTRCSSTSSSGCWRFTRSRTSASSCSGWGRRWCSRRLGRRQWSAIAFAAALLHTLNHAVFKALLFLGAGVVRAARSERSSSIVSAGCCGGCRGPAARSRSARWRSPGCRR